MTQNLNAVFWNCWWCVRITNYRSGSQENKSESKYGRWDNKVEYDMSGVLLEKPRPNKKSIDLTLNYRVITG